MFTKKRLFSSTIKNLNNNALVLESNQINQLNQPELDQFNNSKFNNNKLFQSRTLFKKNKNLTFIKNKKKNDKNNFNLKDLEKNFKLAVKKILYFIKIIFKKIINF